MSRPLALFFAMTGIALAIPAPYESDGTWKALASIPIVPRQEWSVVALSNTDIAMIGGIVPNASGQGMIITPLMQIYNIPSDTRYTASPAPTPVNHPSFAAVNGRLYLLGGLTIAPDGSWRAFSDSWAYDHQSDVWEALEPWPLSEERGSATTVVYGEMIYLAGGMRTLEPIGPDGEQDTVGFVPAFNTSSQDWIAIPQVASALPEGRDQAAASIIGTKMYVIGGRLRGQYSVKDTVFVFDLEDLESGWSTLLEVTPTAQGGVVCGTVGEEIFVLGGEGNEAEGSDGVFDETEVFNTKTKSWKKLDVMPLPRHGGSAVAVDELI
ncbi:galactose oxidase [Polychaeton citri CBS 116435]|uniref:Galactose oxidase n=1 Tax=Polychaeton citri CBS 116435 TaxID=1314669 RepID=A0A9P4Q245_9PEZI|nr:galactose oxidase [Polychaeton citri CBS 116435]